MTAVSVRGCVYTAVGRYAEINGLSKKAACENLLLYALENIPDGARESIDVVELHEQLDEMKRTSRRLLDVERRLVSEIVRTESLSVKNDQLRRVISDWQSGRMNRRKLTKIDRGTR